MATTTTYYGMSKPTLLEAADIRVINGDIDTIDRVMHSHMVSMAPVFDPSSTYDVGDLVMYNDILYRCKTAISTASAWDATKWDVTNITSEFPEGAVVANPSGEATADLTKLKVGNTIYGVEGGGGIDYSTTEQNTGLKWIDGSTIYERTYDNLSVQTNGTNWVAINDIDVTNIDQIINAKALRTHSSGKLINMPLGECAVLDGALKISMISTTFDDTIRIMVLQYTKTSS